MSTAICLLFASSEVFAQCGADGKQPCNTTPKNTSPKKTTTKPKQAVSKTNKTQPIKTKKINANLNNPLKSKLIGKWDDENGDLTWTFFANGTGYFWDKNSICQKFRYVLTGDALRFIITWAMKESQCLLKNETDRIEFNEDNNLIIEWEDKTFAISTFYKVE